MQQPSPPRTRGRIKAMQEEQESTFKCFKTAPEAQKSKEKKVKPKSKKTGKTAGGVKPTRKLKLRTKKAKPIGPNDGEDLE